MNRISRIAALAVTLAAAGTAFADDITIEAPQTTTSTVTRAQVQAELAQFKRPGVANPWSTSYDQFKSVQSTKTRAEVRAETLQAVASGEIAAIGAESNGFDGSFKPAGRTASLQLASASK